MNYTYYLEQFRDFHIDKSQLFELVPSHAAIAKPLLFDRFHVIHALKLLQGYHISLQEFNDWITILWSKDKWFCFPENQAECISSIVYELEEYEEQNQELDEEHIKKFMFALQHNLDCATLN